MVLGEQELRRILGRCLSGEEGKEVCGGSFETKFKLKQAGKKAVQVWNDKCASALKFNGWWGEGGENGLKTGVRER